MSSCVQCLPEPEVDTSPPSVELIIYYFDETLVSRTISDQDGGITIEADEDRYIKVVYSGQDEQGINRIRLFVSTISATSSGSREDADYQIDPKIAECPTEKLSGSMQFDGISKGVQLHIKSMARNWYGIENQTPPITIIAKK